MRLAFDIDSRRVVSAEDLTTFITAIKVRRGEVVPFDVTVVRNGVAVEEEGAEIEVYLTKAADFAALLASETGITSIGSGADAVHSGELDLDESAINALFPSGATLSAPASLELRLTTASSDYRSEPVAVTIQNSYTAP